MVEKARLEDAVRALNDALGEITPYKLAVVVPSEVGVLGPDENARYMPKKVFDQLVDNIKRDSNLSSLPFLWRKADGSFVCLSGNHRIMAAREAGIPMILALYTDQELSGEERVAIQLSHNSLVGMDDPMRLRELWDKINSIDLKAYSGLDDDLLKKYEPIDISRIGEEQLRFEELRLMFVPDEIEHITNVLDAIGSTNHPVLLGRLEDFDQFFDALLEFKQDQQIYNTATAFLRMVDIVAEWLREHSLQADGVGEPVVIDDVSV